MIQTSMNAASPTIINPQQKRREPNPSKKYKKKSPNSKYATARFRLPFFFPVTLTSLPATLLFSKQPNLCAL